MSLALTPFYMIDLTKKEIHASAFHVRIQMTERLLEEIEE